MRQQIIDQKAKELKQYVGLAMSLDECEDFVSGVVEQLATNDGSASVSASTVKSLHTALTNLLQATDDEGWNNEGEDWEEQLEARMILAQTPKEYLR